MTRCDFVDLLNRLADAWRQRDYQRAAEFFAHDVDYSDPLNYKFENLTDLRRFFEADDGAEQKCVWRVFVFDEEAQIAAAEYTYEGTNRYHGVALIKFENNKIRFWREYQHKTEVDWREFWANNVFASPDL